jgi:PAS domain S-box-containing protein
MILEDWDKSSEVTLHREVVIQDRIFGETIVLHPQFLVARIYAFDITERKQTEDALRFLGSYAADSSGEQFFKDLANYLALTLRMPYVCIDRLEDDHLSARTLAVFHDGRFEDNVAYTLKETPCGDAVGQSICLFPQNVCGLFPEDAVLEELQAESYIGVTLFNTQGVPIGLIALIGRHPLTDTRQAESILKLVSARAAGVLESHLAGNLLQESERRFRDIAGASADWIWETGRDGRYIFASGRVQEVLGYAPEQILGRTPFDLMPPEEAQRVRNEFQSITKSQAPFHDLENICLNTSGEIRYIQTSGVPVFDGQGELCGYRGVDKNITERKKTEQRLHLLTETASLLLAFEAPQDLIEMLCIKAMTLLDCQIFFNYLFDADKGRLRLNACAGIPKEKQRALEWLDRCATVSDCAVRNASRNNPGAFDPSQTELVRSYGILASACYPLMTYDKVLGSLSFLSSKDRFSDGDLSFMKALASQIATALERTLNAQALKKSHDDLELRVAERTTELAGTVNALLEEIDEREKVEEALEKSARDIEDLYNNAPCGYHSLDKDGTFIRINDTELQWLGYDRDEVVDRLKITDVLTPESCALFLENYPRFLKDHAVRDLRFSLIRKDGSILPVLLNATAILDADGTYVMSRSTMYDITELVQAEQGVRRMNRLYLTLCETGKAIARIAERDSLFLEICRIAVVQGGFRMAWIGLTDGDSEQLSPLASFGACTDYLEIEGVCSHMDPEIIEPVWTAIRSGGHYVCNDFTSDLCTMHCRFHVEERGFLSMASFAINLKGVPVGAITFYSEVQDCFDPQMMELLVQMQADISFALENMDREVRRREAERLLNRETSEKLRAVEALREKEKMLLQQSRLAAMGEMINNIAHQWRQPLNSLGLVIQKLPVFYDSAQFNREFLVKNTDKAMELIQHMSRTIDDFRDFFRSDKGLKTFALNTAIRKTLSLISHNLKDRNIEVVLHTDGEPMVNGYPNEFGQALMNILTNSSDALIENKTDGARISLHAFSEGGRSIVTVTDNAGGIPEELLGRLFDPYFTTKGPDKGTGLGLFMSKTIIEKNMAGRLTVRNAERGAEFRIEVECGGN